LIYFITALFTFIFNEYRRANGYLELIFNPSFASVSSINLIYGVFFQGVGHFDI